MYKEIVQAILDILKADGTLDAYVKAWYFGQHNPDKPGTQYPFIDVKLRGGPVDKTKTGGSVIITRREIEFDIRLIGRDVNEDVVEKAVLDKTETIESVLDANETLNPGTGATVETSEIIRVDSDAITIGGFSVVGSLTVLKIKRS